MKPDTSTPPEGALPTATTGSHLDVTAQASVRWGAIGWAFWCHAFPLALALALLLLLATLPAFAQSREIQTDDAVQDLLATVANDNFDREDLRLYLAPLTQKDLKTLAEAIRRSIQRQLVEAMELNVALEAATGAEADALRERIKANSVDLRSAGSKYRKVVSAWAERGGDPDAIAEHRRYLWALTTDFLRATDGRAVLGLVRDWVFSASGGGRAMLNLVGFALWVTGLLALAAVVRRRVSRNIERRESVSTLTKGFIASGTYWLTLICGALMVLSHYGFRVSPLLTIFGGASFILGLALQDTIANLASGLMIMINRPFDIGDEIRSVGETGTVEAMTIVSTRIRTPDNQVILIPNSDVWSNRVTNFSASKRRRVDLVFAVSRTGDTDLAIGVLKRLVEADDRCLKRPAPDIYVGAFDEKSVEIRCRPWVQTMDYWDVFRDLTEQARSAFDAEGIAPPVSRMEVRMTPQAPHDQSDR